MFGDLKQGNGDPSLVLFGENVTPNLHKLAREFVLDEMRQAGWSLADEKTFLPYHYFLIFQPAR